MAPGRDRRWRVLFAVIGVASALFIGLSVGLTYAYQSSLPSGCEACGMGAVGLVPFYLLSGVAVVTLLVGFVTWLIRRPRRAAGR